MMKKLYLLSFLLLNFVSQAQFLAKKEPTSLELAINNAKDLNALLKLAAYTKTNKDNKNLVAVFKKIVKLKPQVPLFKFQLAEAYALNDEKTGAFNSLIELQKQGLYFNLEKSTNFNNIKTYPVFNYIKENLEANNRHFGEGENAFFIDKTFSGLLFESIAFDSNSDSFFMGSLRDGSIIRIAGNAEISLFIEATEGGKKGPWATLDLAIDSKNDTLWIASSAITQYGKLTKDILGLSGIFKYKLSTGKLVKSYLLPEKTRPNIISSIHLTPQGELYLLSARKNIVLKLNQESGKYSIVFSSKKYTNLRNITSDETGNYLYLSDVENGIVVADLKNQAIFNLASSKTLNLTNIADIIYDDTGLIIIQNGFIPERVLRLKLKKDKINIDKILPIESANPLFNSPSYGIIVDDSLYYIANSQLPKTNIQGGLLKKHAWENMTILSSPKHFEEKMTLEYQKSIDRYKKAKGVK